MATRTKKTANTVKPVKITARKVSGITCEVSNKGVRSEVTVESNSDVKTVLWVKTLLDQVSHFSKAIDPQASEFIRHNIDRKAVVNALETTFLPQLASLLDDMRKPVVPNTGKSASKATTASAQLSLADLMASYK